MSDKCPAICDLCRHLKRKPFDVNEEKSFCEVKQVYVWWDSDCDDFVCICEKEDELK